MRADDLKPFQTQAVARLARMIQRYGTDPGDRVFDRRTGVLVPYVCHLKAITGAGKTPMLAHLARQLGNAVILWTTNRGAVVDQTVANLEARGKYHALLPAGTDVHRVGADAMSDGDWQNVFERTDGASILVATAASFNREGDVLRIHRGDPSPWKRLSGDPSVAGFRRRDLYVFYDEGHGATETQFGRLAQLRPNAFVLASAADIPEDLVAYLPADPSEGMDALRQAVARRTVLVPASAVAAAGLLKDTLYFEDSNLRPGEALASAVRKRDELAQKLAHAGGAQPPIACYVVNSTARGVAVWRELRAQNVPAEAIAVHLAGARDFAADQGVDGIRDTYTGLANAARSPQALREAGFTHIIWNLTLREGWDEPFAYVAYIDGKGKSHTDIVQKIGRFIRQPNARPFADADLNSAYFYFNANDPEFLDALLDVVRQLEGEGHTVRYSPGKSGAWPRSVEEPPKAVYQVPKVSLHRGRPADNDDTVLRHAVVIDESERRAPGAVRTVAVDVRRGFEEDPGRSREEDRPRAGSATAWELLAQQLRATDSRILDEKGNIFSAALPEHPRMAQPIEFGSPAVRTVGRWADAIVAELQDRLTLLSFGIDQYTVPPFILVNPDASGPTPAAAERYRVRAYRNGVHARYNDLNPFEVRVAAALDRTGLPWCRNPPGPAGYGIPLPLYGGASHSFKPDFLLFGGGRVWAIDPKGEHLAEGAVRRKLLDLRQYGVSVAFVMEGKFTSGDDGLVRNAATGYTIVSRIQGARIVTERGDDLDALLKGLIDAP